MQDKYASSGLRPQGGTSFLSPKRLKSNPFHTLQFSSRRLCSSLRLPFLMKALLIFGMRSRIIHNVEARRLEHSLF